VAVEGVYILDGLDQFGDDDQLVSLESRHVVGYYGLSTKWSWLLAMMQMDMDDESCKHLGVPRSVLWRNLIMAHPVAACCSIRVLPRDLRWSVRR
jgi:hypothetical protein